MPVKKTATKKRPKARKLVKTPRHTKPETQNELVCDGRSDGRSSKIYGQVEIIKGRLIGITGRLDGLREMLCPVLSPAPKGDGTIADSRNSIQPSCMISSVLYDCEKLAIYCGDTIDDIVERLQISDPSGC